MNSQTLEKLLLQWGNSLINLKIDSVDSGLNGGLLCPSCARVHGRSVDASYGFMTLYSITNDIKYKNSAIDLLNWTKSLKYPDGSWGNDLHILEWKGITVFNLITLLSILKDFRHLLNEDEYKNIFDDSKSASEYIYNLFTIKTGNINYPMSATYAMHMAGKILNEEKYKDKAEQLSTECLEYFNYDNIIFGEGWPQDSITKNNCRPIDICYNVEESLPNLALYALDQKNNALLTKIEKSYQSHLRFMIDDGGWDNSWCSRMYKWSYWGSRTSDGCQLGLVALASKKNNFYDAAEKNFTLLINASKSGLLAGGMGYSQANEKICVHHTICHFKSLSMLFINFKNKLDLRYDQKLQYNFDEYTPENTQATLLRKYGWRATFSNYDWIYADGATPSGGSLTFLKHDDFGLVFASGLNRNVSPEPFNMQSYIHRKFESVTPRIESRDANNIQLLSIECLDANIERTNKDKYYIYRSTGYLANSSMKELKGANYNLAYKFLNNGEINFEFSTDDLSKSTDVILPFIILPEDEILCESNTFKIKRSNSSLMLTFPNDSLTEIDEGFNYSPGFLVKNLKLKFKDKITLNLKIT